MGSAVGETVEVTCSLGYGGEWPPVLSWSSPTLQDRISNVSYSTDGGQVKHVISVGPFDSNDVGMLDVVDCVSSIGPQPSNLPTRDGEVLDTSIPEYTPVSCSVGFNIQCKYYLADNISSRNNINDTCLLFYRLT